LIEALIQENSAQQMSHLEN